MGQGQRGGILLSISTGKGVRVRGENIKDIFTILIISQQPDLLKTCK